MLLSFNKVQGAVVIHYCPALGTFFCVTEVMKIVRMHILNQDMQPCNTLIYLLNKL